MNALLQQVLGSIDQNTVNRIAGQIGASPEQTQSAVGAALPLILGAVGRQTGSDQGAQALHALAQNHAGLDVSQILGMVGGGGGMSSVLGQIFGANQNRAAQGVGAASGLPPQSAMQLLTILGPIVMSVIGNHAQQNGVSAQGLGQVVSGAAQHAQSQSSIGSSLLAAVLDKDGDGDVDFSDIMAAAQGGQGQPSAQGGLGGLLGSMFGSQ